MESTTKVQLPGSVRNPDLFPLPAYQTKIGVPPSVNPGHVIGRGIPDVAGVGDPNTGVEVPQMEGPPQVIGGTSAVAPLWAGLVARVNQSTGSQSGFMNPFLYKNCATGVLNDVTERKQRSIPGL
jgi:kumamolisin